MPVIGENEFLFGKEYTEEEALQLVDLGKKTTQAKNCMNCHTLLGNGAYYAPDLTKAWLDKGWISKEMREDMMVKFLMDPEKQRPYFRQQPENAKPGHYRTGSKRHYCLSKVDVEY